MTKVLYDKQDFSKYLNLKRSSCFNAKYLISKQPDNFLQDSSFQKEIIKKKLKNKRKQLIYKKILETTQNLKTTNHQLVNIRKDIKYQKYLSKLDQFKREFLIIQNKKATKIQAAVKGWLVRKTFENDLIRLNKESLEKKISIMHETETYCRLNIGSILKSAATKIQRFMKRRFFIKKLKTLKILYKSHLEKKKEPIYLFIHKAIKIFSAKNTIFELKFEKEKLIKLEKIKRKLALISIKKCLKKKKILVKSIRQKIIRYKKLEKYSNRLSLMKQAIENQNIDRAERKHNSMIVSPSSFTQDFMFKPETQENQIENSNQPILVHEIQSNTELVISAQDVPNIERLETNPLYKKSSRSIYNVKEINIIPLLYQRELENRPHTHHFTRTSASISRMLEATPTRSPPKFVNKIRNRVQSACNHTTSPPTFNYLQQTICSQMKSVEKYSQSATPKIKKIERLREVRLSRRQKRTLKLENRNSSV